MKKIYSSLNGIFIATALFFMLTTTPTAAQTIGVRQDFYSLPSSDQTLLSQLMADYIDELVVATHLYNTPMVHMNPNFFPFHRAYIAGMEDYLILRGYPQFVPLPKWDPVNFISSDLSNIDSNACFASSDPDSSSGCGSLTGTAANPNRSLANRVPGFNFCDYSTMENLRAATEGPWHNYVHGTVGGVMGNFKSPSAMVFWPWHAYVDDVLKEWECDCNNAPDLDLWMRDRPMELGMTSATMNTMSMDMGYEPNPETGPIYRTTDIWIRNTNDGLSNDEHQDPIYDGQNDVYVYVRIRNRGCLASSTNATVNLYWSKTGTGQDWPIYWDGTVTGSNNLPLSGLIATKPIPPIDAGGSTIVEFVWTPKDPDLYINETWLDSAIWNFCFVAKIDGGTGDPDPDPNDMVADMRTNVKEHNNLVWRNVQVDDVTQRPAPCRIVAVGNGSEAPEQTIDLQFATLDVPRNGEIWEEAEIVITLDPQTWNIWNAGGMQADNMRIFNEEERQLIITGNNAYLRNLTYNAPRQRSLICLSANFLIEEVSDREEFQYQVIQRRSSDQSMMGGQAFIYRRDAGRQDFLAEGQQTLGQQTETTQLSATSIGEPATYNWYANDSLVHTGTNMTVSPATDQEYKLEVIADADGHKDYDTVSVAGTGYDIESMTPNPASSSVVVTYDVEQATTASLQINSISGAPLGSYNLDLTTNQKTIDVSNYPVGLSIVTLIVDGVNTDSKNLVIE